MKYIDASMHSSYLFNICLLQFHDISRSETNLQSVSVNKAAAKRNFVGSLLQLLSQLPPSIAALLPMLGNRWSMLCI